MGTIFVKWPLNMDRGLRLELHTPVQNKSEYPQHLTAITVYACYSGDAMPVEDVTFWQLWVWAGVAMPSCVHRSNVFW